MVHVTEKPRIMEIRKFRHLCSYLPKSGTDMVVCVRCFKEKKRDPKKNYWLKRSKIRQEGASPVSEVKRRIQALVREGVILRDGGCILRDVPGFQCGGYRKDGQLILQADHLQSRAFNSTYADLDGIVCICKGHHGGFKKWNKDKYDQIVKDIVGPERWNRVLEKAKQKIHFGLKDWEREEKRLVDEIAVLYQRNIHRP